MKRPLEMAHDFLAEVVTKEDVVVDAIWEMVMTRFF
ncbi:SAM-dependent methyltransferase [Streptococcus pneumoniae]|nr:SAM-dependent methyltransferase [Streptococcus pneumoniae]